MYKLSCPLKKISINNLASSMHLSICLSHIKYEVFTSERIQDVIHYSYILVYSYKRILAPIENLGFKLFLIQNVSLNNI